MKIFKALYSGCTRSLRIWKGILITWFCWLVPAFFVTIPFKSSLNSGIGRSAINERLLKGFDIEVISDLGDVLTSMTRSVLSEVMLLVLAGILLNAFLSGGLFNSLKSPANKFSASEFFRSGAKNFISFLVITLIISAILVVLGAVIIGVPVGIASSSNSMSESTPFIIGTIAGSVYVITVIIFFLVADYARAWQVRNEKIACFKAIGFGFERTFKKLFSSFPMMLIVVLVQILFGYLVIKIVGKWKPVTGGGVFLLFLISQIIFYINLLLKTWRYGSVTSLMEINNKHVPAENTANADPGNQIIS